MKTKSKHRFFQCCYYKYNIIRKTYKSLDLAVSLS